ncbi:MAG TPA: RNA polymerase sigma factor [Kofleriaceae bacterium]|nr:RNA polymerase sigma factor [Kofleriaceae bacterium]
MSDLDLLRDDVRTSWQRFLDVFEPLRPELYRYCRYLTRSPWDAEDLVQDALARGFVTLGTRFHDLPSPRAWIFRVASSSWIDRVRRRQREQAILAEVPPDLAPEREPRAIREAAGTLLVQLSPQERAAVVLKDVFDLSLDEIAQALSTTVGAIKAALHRGRGKLVEPEVEVGMAPRAAALDDFCAAFNARDLTALTALLLDTAVTEIVGVVTEYGAEEPAHPETGSFFHSLTPITRTETGGIAAQHLVGYAGGPPCAELRLYRDAPIVLVWFDHADGPAVRAVWTVEADGDRIARVRNYFFTPDVIAEVCRELVVPFRVNGYRYW